MVRRRCIHAQLRIFQSSKQPIGNGDRYADTQAPKTTVRQGNCQLVLALGYSNCEHQLDDSDCHKEYRTGNDKHRVFRRCRFLREPHKPCATPSNENKVSSSYRGASANRSGSVLIIGKRGRAAGSRSLHRMVRRFIHLIQLIIWMLWGLMETEV